MFTRITITKTIPRLCWVFSPRLLWTTWPELICPSFQNPRRSRRLLPDSPQNSAPLKTIAGGSVANTIRGLAAGFGISCGLIGAFGDDDQGNLFINNMTSYGIDLSKLRLKKGPTAQCVCLVDESGNRTMRPCLFNAVKVQNCSLQLCIRLKLAGVDKHLHLLSAMNPC